MKKKLFFAIIFLNQLMLFAQQDAWVYFTDKQNVEASLENPNLILSQKAINRKNTHGVLIDERDVPVNKTYISQLKNATGITVMAKSKWFNAVHVRGSLVDINNLNTTFSFVKYIVFADKSLNTTKTIKQKQQSKLENVLTAFQYGSAANQVQMIKADYLHSQNYTGTGITVAVLDGGFTNVNTMSSFKRLRDAGNILGVYDFVDRDEDVYTNTTTSHGTLVLSTMAGYIENQYVGTAPDASYYLFITEDGNLENPVEESYWVEAAERADSLGVDVINTSLGYTHFDNANYNYTAADMNGYTTFITKGANIAFEKGMLLVNSAGNQGSLGISAPADSPNVLTVGAVNASSIYASLSSVGSAIQPSMKPDVVAQGESSFVIDSDGIIKTSNGTSFSSPILAGAVVCLWQALPNKTNAEIMQLVRESASVYNNPTYFLGYGIPNFVIALNLALSITGNTINDAVKVFPNPTKDVITFKIPSNESALSVVVFNVTGKQVLKSSVNQVNNQMNLSSLVKGLYFVKIDSNTLSKTVKLIKH